MTPLTNLLVESREEFTKKYWNVETVTPYEQHEYIDSLIRKAYLLGQTDTVEYVKKNSAGGNFVYSISKRKLEALDSAIGETKE